MAQHDYIISNATFPAVRTDLNNALSAIQTTNSGTSRPTGAVAGQLWLDTTSATTPTLKYYDGADDISLATIDHTANTVNWLDSTVSITGLSTTATGTVLTLSDSASTSTVNLIIDNQKEIRFRETTANGTNYVAFKAPASLSADITYTLPSADATLSGQALTSNGSGTLSWTTISSGLSWDSSVKTASTFTAVVNKGYFVDTTSNAITCTLPASATAGDVLAFVDYSRNWGTNKLTLNPNSLKFQGYSSPNPEYNTSGQSVQLVYSGSTKGWIPTVDDDVTNEVPQTYSVDFLVIAGGGSGGSGGNSGGGGAGGFRTSTQTVSITNVITVTVGDGGALVNASSGGLSGNTGSNSSISGSGLTTITSAGGGGGGYVVAGLNGGSGGGGGLPYAGGSGNTPSTSPSQGNNGGSGAASAPAYGAGGGGGSNAIGVNGSGSGGGTGGAGTANSITGSSVTRAGGGGGSADVSTGTGGTGGGGSAGTYIPSTAGTAGSTNTGSGGGGCQANINSGAGGKGVVILSLPTANYSSTTTGSPTVTTSGSNTILQFNGSGSYTA
jgi:hypothetical protein